MIVANAMERTLLSSPNLALSEPMQLCERRFASLLCAAAFRVLHHCCVISQVRFGGTRFTSWVYKPELEPFLEISVPPMLEELPSTV